MRILVLIVTAALGAAAPSMGAPTGTLTLPTELHYSRAIEYREIVKGRPDSVSTTRDDLRAGLARDRLVLVSSEEIAVRDFTTNTVRHADPDTRTYYEYSLFPQAAFADREIRNRVQIARMFASMNQGAGRAALLDQEAWLRMKAPAATREGVGRVMDRREGGELVIELDGRPHVRATWSDTALDTAAREAFGRFLLFALRLHPDARERLVAEGRLPRSLTVSNRDVGRAQVTQLELVSMNPLDPRLGEIPGEFRHASLSEGADDSLAALLRRGVGICPRSPDSLRRETQAFMAAAATRGQPLDAFLASVEFGIATGSQGEDLWTADLKQQARKDPRMAEYSKAASFSMNKPAEARKAVPKLEGIDRAGLEKGYVLDTEIGNAHQAAGEGEDGRQHLEAALRRNPCLAGVWVDIGAGCLDDFMTWSAWECFDVARAILPAGSPLLARVEALERDLRTRHPEYF